MDSTRATFQVQHGAASDRSDHCALFCLPYAGGDSLAYWRWTETFPGSVRVRMVQLPARDARHAEPGGIVVSELAAQIAPHVSQPYALYGHSMGARLAFEIVRDRQRAGLPLPVRLYVGAAHPPHLPEPIARLARLSEEQFLDQLILRAGTPSVVRDDADVRAAVMPALRVDLHWLKQYRYRPDGPLPVPIVAFAGFDDREVPRDLMLGWARHTSAGFRLHTLVGDHLFLATAGDTVAAMISADLGAVTDGGSDTVASPAPDELHVWRFALNGPSAPTSTVDSKPAGDVPGGTAQDQPDAVRRLLGRYRVDPPSRDAPDLRWAVSRSAGTAIVVVAREAVALHVEAVRPVPDLDAFCERALEPAERAEVLAEPEELQLREALRRWSAKEAVRKAQIAAGDRCGPHGWWVTHLDLDGAVAAVATPGGPWRLRFQTLVGNGQ